MALTLNANWRRAMEQSGAEPRFHVRIETGSGDINGLDGEVDNKGIAFGTGGTDVGIVQVTPLTQEIDVFSRRMQISSVFVTVHDKWIRDFMIANRLRGQSVRIRLGERSLPLLNFEDYFNGVIDSIQPSGDGQTVVLTCVDYIAYLRTQKVVGYWNQQHPLQVIDDILTKAGVPAGLIESTSLDPSTAAFDEIGHFVVGRSEASGFAGDDHTVREPTEPWELINQLLIMCNGSLVTNEDGKLEFKIFDSAAATVADWTDEQIGDFQQMQLEENAINRVVCGFLGFPREYEQTVSVSSSNINGVQTQTPNKVQKMAQGFQFDETASQAAFADAVGGGPGIYEANVNMPWVTGVLRNDLGFTAVEDPITLQWWGSSFCGTRGIRPGPQPAEAVVSGSKPAYIYLQGEILEVTSITDAAGPTYDRGSYEQVDPEQPFSTQAIDVELDMGLLELAVTRAQFGTTAVASTDFNSIDDYVLDVTIPVYVCQKLLERFAFGAFMIQVRTSIREYDKQLLDLVTIDNRNFIGFGFDGMTAGAGKWEIIQKEVDLYGDPPGINWVLQFIPSDSITVTARSWLASHRRSSEQSDIEEISASATSQGYLAEGFTVTSTGGLGIEISSGRIGGHRKTGRTFSTVAKTLAANSDVYIWLDYLNMVFGFLTVPNSDPEPDRPKNGVFIAKVITGAATVSSIEQDKDPNGNVITQPFNGNRIQENTLGQGSLNTQTRAISAKKTSLANFDFGAFSREPDNFGG